VAQWILPRNALFDTGIVQYVFGAFSAVVLSMFL